MAIFIEYLIFFYSFLKIALKIFLIYDSYYTQYVLNTIEVEQGLSLFSLLHVLKCIGVFLLVVL